MSPNLMACLAALISACLMGCGGGAPDDLPELVSVTGTVTMDGAPVEGAQVVFEPEKGPAASGMTNATGKFELYTGSGHAGAVPGIHMVRISKMEGDAGSELIPARYNINSEMARNVDAPGPNEIKIELSSKPGGM
jgi:hypothetical protein